MYMNINYYISIICILHRDGGNDEGDGYGEIAQVAEGLLCPRLHAIVQVQEGLGP